MRAIDRPRAERGVEDGAGGGEDVHAVRLREPGVERGGLAHALRDGPRRTLQIARGRRAGERGELHRAVFGKDEQLGARAGGLGHPARDLVLVGGPAVEKLHGVGGGGDLHGPVS